MKLAYAKELYAAEWQRRDQMTGSFALPVGVLTLIGGGLAVFAEKFTFSPGHLTILFAVPFATAVITSFISLVYLLRAYRGPPYCRIPFASEIHAFESDLAKYYEATSQLPPADVEAEVERELLTRYIQATDRNAANNMRAGELLFRATGMAAVTLALTLVAGVPYVLDQRLRVVHHAAETSGGGGVRMTDENTNQGGGKDQPPPSKPELPPNKDVRTDIKEPLK